MVVKPGKLEILRCMFLLAILGVDPAQTWQNTKGGYVYAYTINQ